MDSNRHHQASIVSAYSANASFKTEGVEEMDEEDAEKLIDIDLDIFSPDEENSEEKQGGKTVI